MEALLTKQALRPVISAARNHLTKTGQFFSRPVTAIAHSGTNRKTTSSIHPQFRNLSGSFSKNLTNTSIKPFLTPNSSFQFSGLSSLTTVERKDGYMTFYAPKPWEYETTLKPFPFVSEEIRSQINKYNTFLDSTLVIRPTPLKECVTKMVALLENTIETIENYRFRAPANISIGHLKTLPHIQEMCRNNITILQKLSENAEQLNGSLTFRQAFELTRLGYPLDSPLSKRFTCHQLNSTGINLGGSIETPVLQLAYKTAGSSQHKVFKSHLPFDERPFANVAGYENYLDVNEPKFAGRNFAAKALDGLLGTRLIPDFELAIYEGKAGIIGDMAEGIQPMDQDTFEYADVGLGRCDNPELLAQLQKNLCNAEWVDGSCGQQDRHGANFIINPVTGKVTLIDNDYSFYPKQYKVRTPSLFSNLRRYSGSTAGLSPLIDRAVYNRLSTITPGVVKQELEGLITEQEIEATIARIQQQQEHAHSLAQQGRVVDDWVNWRDPETGLNVSDFQNKFAPDSYFVILQGKAGRL